MDSMIVPFAPAPDLAALGIPALDPALLEELFGQTREKIKPVVPPHYKKPPKPSTSLIAAAAKRQEEIHAARIDRQMEILGRLRFKTTGIFPQDREAIRLGDMDTWTSSALVDDWNLVSAALSLVPISYVKQTVQRADRAEGQAIEDLCAFVRAETEARWVEGGDIILPMAEAKTLTAYGTLVSRNLLDLEDDYCPFDSRLIDPATVFPVFAGRKGLRCVFRRYRTRLADALGDWGDLSRADLRELREEHGGKSLDESTVVTVTEYWDCHWRSVTIGDQGTALMPVKEHGYYHVPWVIQHAPNGEPLFTDTALAGERPEFLGVEGYRSGPQDDWGLEHKGLGLIDLQRPRHDQYEALLSLILLGLRRGIDPAYVLKRPLTNAGDDPEPVDRRGGEINELFEGESLDILPTGTPAGETQVLLNAANTDRMSGSSPLTAFGVLDGVSNVSGVARSGAAEQGQDKIAPFLRTLEAYHAQVATMWVRQFRNDGHLARYEGGEARSFLVPSQRPSVAEDTLSAVTPEAVDRVGPRVTVKMNRLRVQDMMPLASAGKQLHDMGVIDLEWMADQIGVTDFERMRARNRSDKAEAMRSSLPEFAKIVEIPLDLIARIRDTDDPVEREALTLALDKWERFVSQPTEAQMAPPPQPQAAPGMTPPANTGTPGAAGGVSYAQVGQGPGSLTGVQGGPQGPYTPQGPPLGPQGNVPYGAP